MYKCLITDEPIKSFINFGKMPLGNGFLLPEQYQDEYFFEMEMAFSPKSKMVQLVRQPEPEQMFHENYAFFSSTSIFMADHFKAFADYVTDQFLGAKTDPFVVELGSNDGIMLENFAKAGVRHLGIEPSENVAAVARKKGIETLSKFFNAQVAKEIVAEHGQVDTYLAANVMCHIPSLRDIVEGIKILLKPDGVAIFEDPYLGDVIKKTSYDQIYDEHTFLFSASSIQYLFGLYDLELIDVLPQRTHGGSMRYVLGHRSAHAVSPHVGELLAEEEQQGLHLTSTYDKFRVAIENSRAEFVSLLKKLKSEGKRVVGYGATSKSTTILNYCGIGPDLIEFICDTTPIKQNKSTPGVHIPVKPHSDFTNNFPDYAILFAWNHAEEIFLKEKHFANNGGKWILFVPEVKVV